MASSWTVLLGISFTCVQAYEYAHAPFAFKGSIYGSTFFMATGFPRLPRHHRHDLPIICLLRALAGQFTPQRTSRLRICRLFWHFVDVVWLFLFSCIYVWGSWGGPFEH